MEKDTRLMWVCLCFCVSAAGGASKWPEANEDSAKEAASSDEGEGPAAERTQSGSAGSQQTGVALQGATETQQDLKGTSVISLVEILKLKTIKVFEGLVISCIWKHHKTWDLQGTCLLSQLGIFQCYETIQVFSETIKEQKSELCVFLSVI